jgi:enoyl-CoA hydratase/carnithine racemase
MNYENLIVEIGEKYLAEITLNRPEHLNTFNSIMAGELYDALSKLDAQKNVRVVLLKGAGKAFCAGIDVNELADKSAMEYRAWIELRMSPGCSDRQECVLL